MSSNLKLILQRGFALQLPSHRPLQSPHTEDTHKRTSSSIWSADCYISSCYRLCTTRCASLCASSLRLRISIVYISRDFFAFVVESNANRVSFIVCYLAVIAACVNIMPIVSSTSNPLYAAGGRGMGGVCVNVTRYCCFAMRQIDGVWELWKRKISRNLLEMWLWMCSALSVVCGCLGVFCLAAHLFRSSDSWHKEAADAQEKCLFCIFAIINTTYTVSRCKVLWVLAMSRQTDYYYSKGITRSWSTKKRAHENASMRH